MTFGGLTLNLHQILKESGNGGGTGRGLLKSTIANEESISSFLFERLLRSFSCEFDLATPLLCNPRVSQGVLSLVGVSCVLQVKLPSDLHDTVDADSNGMAESPMKMCSSLEGSGAVFLPFLFSCRKTFTIISDRFLSCARIFLALLCWIYSKGLP